MWVHSLLSLVRLHAGAPFLVFGCRFPGVREQGSGGSRPSPQRKVPHHRLQEGKLRTVCWLCWVRGVGVSVAIVGTSKHVVALSLVAALMMPLFVCHCCCWRWCVLPAACCT